MVLDILSNPYEGNFRELACKLALRSFKVADEMCAKHLNQDSLLSGIDQDIIRLSLSADDYKALGLWRPGIGHVRLEMLRLHETENSSWFNTNLKLALFLSGIESSLHIICESDKPIIVCGNFLNENWLEFNGANDILEILDANGKKILHLRKSEGCFSGYGWISDTCSEDSILIKEKALVSLADARWYDYWLREPGAEILPQTADKVDYSRSIIESLTCLHENSPAYFSWIVTAIKELMPQVQFGHGTDSASFILCPGIVHLSKPPTVASGISALVHESSHQYFHMLMWNTIVVDPDAPESYSSLKDRRRPLSALLLGHHALANVCLALGELIECGYSDVSLIPEYEHNLTRLKSLIKSISTYDSEFLNGIGNSIFLSLNKRLINKNYI